jgi:SSS family solute:Na+ symporter
LQSVQAYISPPISACFVLGILWPRLNGAGAISSLLTGFVMGATRFILELADQAGGGHFQSSVARWIIDMNFLHYAIFMFVVCSLVLVIVSLMTKAPERAQLAGLTFATVDEKIESTVVDPRQRKPAHETPMEHRINVVFSLLLLATVIGLWVYFR